MRIFFPPDWCSPAFPFSSIFSALRFEHHQSVKRHLEWLTRGQATEKKQSDHNNWLIKARLRSSPILHPSSFPPTSLPAWSPPAFGDILFKSSCMSTRPVSYRGLLSRRLYPCIWSTRPAPSSPLCIALQPSSHDQRHSRVPALYCLRACLFAAPSCRLLHVHCTVLGLWVRQ